jgi:hypothetical protein
MAMTNAERQAAWRERTRAAIEDKLLALERRVARLDAANRKVEAVLQELAGNGLIARPPSLRRKTG